MEKKMKHHIDGEQNGQEDLKQNGYWDGISLNTKPSTAWVPPNRGL